MDDDRSRSKPGLFLTIFGIVLICSGGKTTLILQRNRVSSFLDTQYNFLHFLKSVAMKLGGKKGVAPPATFISPSY